MPFTSPYSPNYLLLDAARMLSDMDKAQELNPNFVSLYKGGPEQHLSSVAPYLFQYGGNQSFEDWIEENSGKSWGIFVRTKTDMEDTNYHFRKFLKVKTEDLQQLYFRFYDPRVLCIFLPTCDRKQIIEFFGPIEYFICEQEINSSYIVYSHKQGELIQTPITIKKKVKSELEIKPLAADSSPSSTIQKEEESTPKKRKWL